MSERRTRRKTQKVFHPFPSRVGFYYFMINCLGWIKISFFICGERGVRCAWGPKRKQFILLFASYENNFSFVYNFTAESCVINFVYGKGMHIHYVIDDRARGINKWQKTWWNMRRAGDGSGSVCFRIRRRQDVMLTFHTILRHQSRKKWASQGRLRGGRKENKANSRQNTINYA